MNTDRIKILNNQTALDVVLQYTGSLENLFAVLLLNNKQNILLNEGEQILIMKASNPKLVKYYQEKQLTLASIDEIFLSQLSNDFDDNDFDTDDFE